MVQPPRRDDRRLALALALLGAMPAYGAEPEAISTPSATPALTATFVAPTALRLEVTFPGPADNLEAVGGPEGQPPQQQIVGLDTREETETDGRRIHRSRAGVTIPVTPGTVYRYRAVVFLSGGRRSPLSEEAVITVPGPSESAPGTPKEVRADVVSPFVVRLVWQRGEGTAYGFEIQRRAAGSEFEHVSVVDPDAREFEDHGRRPATHYAYRLRSFNPRGASEFSPELSTTTPLLETWTPSERPEKAPCTTFEAATRPEAERVDGSGVVGITRVCRRLKIDETHVVDAVASEDGCGQNCPWLIYAEIDGCYRSIGEVFQVGCPSPDVLPVSGGGWPLLVTTAHMSAFEAGVDLSAFVDGTYVSADSYTRCDSPVMASWTNDDASLLADPTRWAPPFAHCQRP